MTVHIHGPQVLVTDEVFVLLAPRPLTFPIEALHQAYVLIVRSWWPRYLTSYELRTPYHGSDVCLLRTSDSRTFGQVRRSLVRALEAGRHRQELIGVPVPHRSRPFIT